MSTAESDVEEQVLKLAGVGLSTRRIASAIGDISQSTVVRILQRERDTGPQSVLRGIDRSQRLRIAALVAIGATLVLMAVTLVVLTAAVATIAWK